MLDTIFSFDTLWWILMLLYVPSCIGLIVIVLLQKGKGTGFAGAFGAGAGPGADTVFGPRMNRSMPVRLTYAAATAFMLIAVVMSLIAGRVGIGQAPEFVEGEAGEVVSQGTELDRFGLGTNRVDAAVLEQTPESEAPASEAASTEPAIDELNPGATMSPAIPEAVDEAASQADDAAGAAQAEIDPETFDEEVDAALGEETPVSQ